ncbi:hypothetical protein HG263_03700 [Pseudoalteromonas sp. JBTF-M23]|uniref:Uncharacterized protein n=1 Tax=Pseudoalteromonas caenipelagi TaxID=2726988 RepID=A0A849VD23_9GAMM|nr:hypothetical protein [Pseudoalteromonas caenipelagi]NOU49647.1 hypothetical protein [Pseudoalteromonas caenipelagi]
MSHVMSKLNQPAAGVDTLKDYREAQMSESRWIDVTHGVKENNFVDNFTFLNNAVLSRYAGDEQLMATTGIFGPITPGTLVHLNPFAQKVDPKNLVVQSNRAPDGKKKDLVTELNELHDKNTNNTPCSAHALCVQGFWVADTDGARIPCLDGASNLFGGTGQLIISLIGDGKGDEAQCDVQQLNFPLLHFGPSKESQDIYKNTLAYYGAKLLAPNEEFELGFTQDLWGIQYDQKLPQYVTDYQFAAQKGGGLFVEHHPFPHIWLPAQGIDPVFNRKTVSRILLGRRLDITQEDGYYRTVQKQHYHFTMFEIPLDGSALAIRPQCIHNDSFTDGAQTVFLANTPANTVALRHSAPIQDMRAGDIPFNK